MYEKRAREPGPHVLGDKLRPNAGDQNSAVFDKQLLQRVNTLMSIFHLPSLLGQPYRVRSLRSCLDWTGHCSDPTGDHSTLHCMQDLSKGEFVFPLLAPRRNQH